MLPNHAAILDAARESVAAITGRPVKDQELLISSGMIDSLSILKLISDIEKRLHISIPTDSLQPDDFDTLDLIVETVQRVAR
jgi:acyl carrier protein